MIKKLSIELTKQLGKGFSQRSLEQYRQFYKINYERTKSLIAQSLQSEINDHKITQSVTAQSFIHIQTHDQQDVISIISGIFPLTWTHYLQLITLTDNAERSFYEIEAKTQNWSVRELKRQVNSSLYERLALSRDKNEVKRLAKDGQVIAKPTDIVKTPLIRCM